jgi:hypothetical protein
MERPSEEASLKRRWHSLQVVSSNDIAEILDNIQGTVCSVGFCLLLFFDIHAFLVLGDFDYKQTETGLFVSATTAKFDPLKKLFYCTNMLQGDALCTPFIHSWRARSPGGTEFSLIINPFFGPFFITSVHTHALQSLSRRADELPSTSRLPVL